MAIGRAFLGDPRWGWHAAEALGALDQVQYPPQYERGGTLLWPGAPLLRPAADGRE